MDGNRSPQDKQLNVEARNDAERLKSAEKETYGNKYEGI